MDEHCRYCNQPRKSRKDRPGKFFTLCAEHYAEYMRRKNRESYKRHSDARIKQSQKYRDENPDAAMNAYRKWIVKPGNREKKKAYMRLYNSPHRAFVQDACERCGYESQIEDRRDLDVHHIDGNHSNNYPVNLQTLCPPCHRIVEAK